MAHIILKTVVHNLPIFCTQFHYPYSDLNALEAKDVKNPTELKFSLETFCDKCRDKEVLQ